MPNTWKNNKFKNPLLSRDAVATQRKRKNFLSFIRSIREYAGSEIFDWNITSIYLCVSSHHESHHQSTLRKWMLHLCQLRSDLLLRKNTKWNFSYNSTYSYKSSYHWRFWLFTLYHKISNYSMKFCSIVVTSSGKFRKISAGNWSMFPVKLHCDFAHSESQKKAILKKIFDFFPHLNKRGW